MNIDFMAMVMDVVDGAIGVAQGLAMSGDMVTLGMAGLAIVLLALIMGSLDQIVSTTITALLAFVVFQVAYAAFVSDWDPSDAVNGVWESFTGTDAVAALSFFDFGMYFIVFAIAIAIVNVVKGMISG